MGSDCGAVSAAGAVRRRLSTELLWLDSYRAMASKPLRGALYAGASGSSCGCCIGAAGRREGRSLRSERGAKPSSGSRRISSACTRREGRCCAVSGSYSRLGWGRRRERLPDVREEERLFICCSCPRLSRASLTQAGCSGSAGLTGSGCAGASAGVSAFSGASSFVASAAFSLWGMPMASSKGSFGSTSATKLRFAVAKAVNSSPFSSAFCAARRAVGLNSSTLSTRGSAFCSRGLYTVSGSSSISGCGGRRLRLISLRGRGSSMISCPGSKCAGGLVKIAWMISWLMEGSVGVTSGSVSFKGGTGASAAAAVPIGANLHVLPSTASGETGAKRRVSCAGASSAGFSSAR